MKNRYEGKYMNEENIKEIQKKHFRKTKSQNEIWQRNKCFNG